MMHRLRTLFLLLLLPAAIATGGCSIFGSADDAQKAPEPVTATDGKNGGLLDGLLGNPLLGGSRSDDGIAVNSYLWRASLDTVSFLPLSTADPFGGVIITDWYSPPESPGERFKVTVYILDRELRADGLRVTVFRQKRETPGGWIEAPVDKKLNRDLENAILKRARQMRIRVNQR
jgi:hypothetical protein